VKLAHITNPIRMVAVICTAITSIYIMWMGYRINEVLAGPLWCSRAIGADKADANSRVDAASSCVGLLTIQLKSLATNSHILFGVVALCLLTLIVIVIAGGRLSVAASKTGVSANMSSSEDEAATAAAAQTATAAVDKAKEIATDGAPSPKPLP
jgi:hypothetical protein